VLLIPNYGKGPKMNDNPPPKMAIVPITVKMVEAGIEILDQLTQVDTPTEDATDAQLVIAIFTRMWQTKMAEEDGIRRGLQPKLKLIKNTLIMPPQGGKQ
jgi:hypothetical protein